MYVGVCYLLVNEEALGQYRRHHHRTTACKRRGTYSGNGRIILQAHATELLNRKQSVHNSHSYLVELVQHFSRLGRTDFDAQIRENVSEFVHSQEPVVRHVEGSELMRQRVPVFLQFNEEELLHGHGLVTTNCRQRRDGGVADVSWPERGTEHHSVMRRM